MASGFSEKTCLPADERRERDGGMRVRHGEVDDDVDVVARQQRIDGQRLDAEFLRPAPRRTSGLMSAQARTFTPGERGRLVR